MNTMEYTHIIHPFEPVYNNKSKILILGSLPSVKSRENQFYYGHPQNRFWKVIANVLNVPVPETIEEKKSLWIKYYLSYNKFRELAAGNALFHQH